MSAEQGLVTQLTKALERIYEVASDHSVKPADRFGQIRSYLSMALSAVTPEAVRKADAAVKMYEALLKIESGLGDRLLAEGPLSPEYAREVLRRLRSARALAEGR